MKYKDFKMLSNDDMKQIVGGNAPEENVGYGTCCTSSGDCGGVSGCSQWITCAQVFKKC